MTARNTRQSLSALSSLSTKVVTRGDVFHVAEDVARVETPFQIVGKPAGEPCAPIAPVTDEDLGHSRSVLSKR